MSTTSVDVDTARYDGLIASAFLRLVDAIACAGFIVVASSGAS